MSSKTDGRIDRRRRPKAIIFDLDDTLIDSFASRRFALERVFQIIGIQTPTAHEFLTVKGGRIM